eukprot:CAMPEP_0206436086 /NCGR_PEP_ID=MMETSP0324_2-20121206/10279_1 /ASSEMBLY_ACC=CAM_ASM_000836 /TAXON_ID=2866 /ORGANISM="Crypthecodinium cohnii, Strain Seligo" /LENGTH=152 /DNA_ID=CAMNT_0053903195 /DNA_START=46 /DNA_END=500 /DNA_ORIENTATION=+
MTSVQGRENILVVVPEEMLTTCLRLLQQHADAVAHAKGTDLSLFGCKECLHSNCLHTDLAIPAAVPAMRDARPGCESQTGEVVVSATRASEQIQHGQGEAISFGKCQSNDMQRGVYYRGKIKEIDLEGQFGSEMALASEALKRCNACMTQES